MLVLTRKPAEMIQIGDDIVVKVIKTAKGTVKIGIDAPAHIRVVRSELLAPKPEASVTATTVAVDLTPGNVANAKLKTHVA